MQKRHLYSLLILTLALSGCLSKTAEYEGISFPRTTKSQVSFEEHKIPANCSAFAHLLMNSRMDSSGKDIASAMEQEAEAKGADRVLVGMTRELVDEELEANRFDYYGPEYAYNFSKSWLGWKFGFGEWNEGGNFVGLGVDNWGKSGLRFDNTLLIQAVFLRCGE